jgi:hypothetical protein
MVDLADGIRAGTPVVDLGRLPRIDAGQLEQRQTVDGLGRKLDALQDQPHARPTRAMLDDQRGPVCLRVGRRLPQQGAGQRENQPGDGPG